MPEYKTLLSKKPLKYEGYFDPKELFSIIKKFIKDKGYFWIERENREDVTPSGKFIYVKINPWKKISDYSKNVISLNIEMSNLKEKTIEIDKVKKKVMHGSVKITSDVILVTDYRAKWEHYGWMYFLRTIIDKFIKKEHRRVEEENLMADFNALENEIRSYLNMMKFKTGSTPI